MRGSRSRSAAAAHDQQDQRDIAEIDFAAAVDVARAAGAWSVVQQRDADIAGVDFATLVEVAEAVRRMEDHVVVAHGEELLHLLRHERRVGLTVEVGAPAEPVARGV
ncbi:MAG: hypothetical protein ACK55I_23145, partial [bacterium]